MTGADLLVSVVVPAYNAEATLDETLLSVRAQTYKALEIIVVDDGSTDGTLAVALRHAAADTRVQVIRQENRGVAAARNHGWRRARAEHIAFVDADDLWAPTKIERQLAVLEAGGSRLGLVYCWCVEIDASGVVTFVFDGAHFEGEVLERLICENFVGNGSSVLVRREALEYANGFDSGLRARGAEGCEDLLFYCRVAERYRYGLVADHLIGYRRTAQSMSSDRPKMLRSWMLVAEQMLARHPQLKGSAQRGLALYSIWLAQKAYINCSCTQIPALLLLLLRHGHPLVAFRMLFKHVLRLFAGDLLRRLGLRTRVDGRVSPEAMDLRFPVGEVE